MGTRIVAVAAAAVASLATAVTPAYGQELGGPADIQATATWLPASDSASARCLGPRVQCAGPAPDFPLGVTWPGSPRTLVVTITNAGPNDVFDAVAGTRVYSPRSWLTSLRVSQGSCTISGGTGRGGLGGDGLFLSRCTFGAMAVGASATMSFTLRPRLSCTRRFQNRGTRTQPRLFYRWRFAPRTVQLGGFAGPGNADTIVEDPERGNNNWGVETLKVRNRRSAPSAQWIGRWRLLRAGDRARPPRVCDAVV